MRALAIALFYAVGTGLGGFAGPWLFGTLIGTGDRNAIAGGYLFGSLLMLIAAAVTARIGVAAECRSLEDVAHAALQRGRRAQPWVERAGNFSNISLTAASIADCGFAIDFCDRRPSATPSQICSLRFASTTSTFAVPTL